MNTNDIYDERVQFKFVIIFQMRCYVIRALLTDVFPCQSCEEIQETCYV